MLNLDIWDFAVEKPVFSGSTLRLKPVVVVVITCDIQDRMTFDDLPYWI